MRFILFLIAVLAGLGIYYIDSQPHWDDAGITAFTILLTCAALGLASPRAPWVWALAVGVWIPLAGIILKHNYGGIFALVFALAGAYAGMLLRRWVSPPRA